MSESPSLLLQRAADKLASMAGDAHIAKAPWKADGSVVWAANGYLVLGGAPWDNDKEPDADADWIATMSPAVAASLVAWLREAARRAESGGWLTEPFLVAALDFSRLILGVSAEGKERSDP